MILIGDVHGKTKQYHAIIQELDEDSIQLGDLGFAEEHLWFLKNVDYSRHKHLGGNHDDPSYCRYMPHTLGDYGMYKDMFFVRGAYSIDKQYRTFGMDWWPEEELSIAEGNEALELYTQIKPSIVLSHDAPHDIRYHFWGIENKSYTSSLLQEMLDIHRPNLWVFGHHHERKDETILGTRFVCIEELGTLKI